MNGIKSYLIRGLKNNNNKLFVEAANFYQKFSVLRNKTIKGLPISGGNKNAKGGGGANEALLYFLVRLINAKKMFWKQAFRLAQVQEVF